MSNFLWVLTDKRKELFEKLLEMPEAGRKPKSILLEMALEEFILRHAKSNNPQTRMDMFQDKLTNGIPHIYAGSKAFDKFYRLIKTKEDYDNLDRNLNIILDIHNKKGRENLK